MSDRRDGDAIVVDAARLGRLAAELLKQVEAGRCVVLQRDGEPAGVLLGYGQYQEWLGRAERLEDLEILALARKREAALLGGEDELVPLEQMLKEFSIRTHG